MKRQFFILSALFMVVLTSCAKKVNVTIDGTVSPTQKTLYLIINEDTANAKLLPIEDAKFSVTVKVDVNDIIRLHDWKEWPERSVFVLIPDSKHITINTWDGTIQGSPMSQKMREAIDRVRKTGPNGFHIDVFSDNEEEWARAREQERRIRAQMEDEQRNVVLETIKENGDNAIASWIAYCYADIFPGGLDEIAKGQQPKWRNHPIFQGK